MSPPQERDPARASMAAGLPQNDLGPTALLVKLLRKVVLDLTQDELSARSGVAAGLISRYENGKVEPARNLDRLLSAAGVLDLKPHLLHLAGELSALLSPPPPSPAPADDPLRVRELLQRTSRRLRLLQPDSRHLTGEYMPPDRRDLASTPLLVRFLRTVLLDCGFAELSRRTGIHRDVLSRYEAGRVRRPGPDNLDRLLAEAQVLHLKEPLLRTMGDLSFVLARKSAPVMPKEPDLISPDRVEELVASTRDLLRRTRESLGLDGEKFSSQVPEDGFDFREE